MKRHATWVAGAMLFAAIVSPGRGDAPARLEVGNFSSASIGAAVPNGWKPLTFEKVQKLTQYQVVRIDDKVAVKAVAEASASGLIKESRIDPREYPIVQWRWKVANVLQKGDVTRKSGDDYPARLYITFEYDPDRASWYEAAKFKAGKALFGPDLPFRAINYIWESTAPQGSFVPNPYTDWTMMIVVESGMEELGKWLVEERNIYEDFKKAFKEEPLMISGVAIMSDTDNTQESATAYYGDIVFKKAK